MNNSIFSHYQEMSNSYQEVQSNSALYCILLWRRNQLLVQSYIKDNNIRNKYFYKLNCPKILVECLNNSPVSLVRIDPRLSQEQLSLWANACQEVNKPIYLRIPSANVKRNISYLCRQWLQLSTNWLLAFLLFLILIPFFILLVIWIKFSSHQPLFTYEWRVGKRGKLFRVIKFCTADIQQITSKEDLYINKKYINMTKMMQILCQYGVDKLPHLLNVLRGDMMLFGSKCWTLRDVINLSSEQQKQLNKMPGIIS